MKKNKIPTDDEFAKASAALKKQSRGLSRIRESILSSHSKEYQIHEFFIFDSTETSFKAYVFFEKDKDISIANESGVIEEIKLLIYQELEHAGRGPREKVDVAFEFDSHENVINRFDGDYFNRLR